MKLISRFLVLLSLAFVAIGYVLTLPGEGVKLAGMVLHDYIALPIGGWKFNGK